MGKFLKNLKLDFLNLISSKNVDFPSIQSLRLLELNCILRLAYIIYAILLLIKHGQDRAAKDTQSLQIL